MKELDVIELGVAVDAWEAGTIATVLEARVDSVLAEVADADGRTLDTLVVPIEAVRPVAAADTAKSPRMSENVRAANARKSAA